MAPNKAWPHILRRIKIDLKIGVRTIAPEENYPPPDNCPLTNAPWMIVPWIIAPRKIASENNFPRGKLSPRIIAPQKIFPLDDCLRIIAPGKQTRRWLPPDNISLEMAPEGNCLSDDLSPTQLPLGKSASRKTAPPKKIVSKINYTRDIFSGRNRKRCPLIDSCFLLFSFFGFIRKNFMSILRLKLLRREEQVKNKLNME